jgi:hypothetical protein
VDWKNTSGYVGSLQSRKYRDRSDLQGAIVNFGEVGEADLKPPTKRDFNRKCSQRSRQVRKEELKTRPTSRKVLLRELRASFASFAVKSFVL